MTRGAEKVTPIHVLAGGATTTRGLVEPSLQYTCQLAVQPRHRVRRTVTVILCERSTVILLLLYIADRTGDTQHIIIIYSYPWFQGGPG